MNNFTMEFVYAMNALVVNGARAETVKTLPVGLCAEWERNAFTEIIAIEDTKRRMQILNQYTAHMPNRDALKELINNPPHFYSDNTTSTVLEPRRAFTVHRADEALLPQAPTEWIVENLFAESTVSLIVGKPGCKKTWALIDLAVAVARGETWLNFQTTAYPVLLIDEESGNKSVLRRLGAAMRGHNATAGLLVSYISLEHIDLRQAEDIAEIETLITSEGARLVIIDALADVMPGGDENAVSDTQPLMMALRGIADRTKACLLVVHHKNKTGTFRGSSALEGACDVMLMVESDPDSNVITFKTGKVRDILPVTFHATAVFESLPESLSEVHAFRLDPGAGSAAQSKRLSDSQEFVLEYLHTNSTATIADIMDAADVCSDVAARKAIYTLAKMDYVSRTDTGGSGKTATYSLTAVGILYAEQIA